jgi:NAD(P)-dependent dehydrogenase (short-subunit alcohol dehydrogenase family)
MYTQRLDVEALSPAPGASFDGVKAYARTKRAQVVLSGLFDARFRDSPITWSAMHPGWADTPGVRTSLPWFRRTMQLVLRSPEEGADTIVWLAAADEPGRVTGRFWLDRAPRSTTKLVPSRATSEERDKLWRLCERLTGAASP